MKGRSAIFIGLLAAFIGGQAGAQTTVVGSPHDLSAEALDTGNVDKGEICVYCHTPHGGKPGAADGGPLWNKPYTGSSFTTYDSSFSQTLDAPETLAVGSVSIACLTCHDGTVAIDSMINAPGTDGYDAAGPGRWATNFSLNGTDNGSAFLGTDLSNDHPIGIEYAGGVSATGTLTDPDFKAVTFVTGGSMAAGPWYVDVDGDTFRDKTDMILYTRAFSAGSGPSVECASCHDPHAGASGDGQGYTGNVAGSDVSFLRSATGTNTGSGVCLACHSK